MLETASGRPVFTSVHKYVIGHARCKSQLGDVKTERSLQGMHSVAFTGALGRPLICPEGGIGNLSADTLHEFVSANFVPSKMVLAGAGVEHKALLNLAEPMLSTAQGGSGSPEPHSEYAGGDFRYSTTCAHAADWL